MKISLDCRVHSCHETTIAVQAMGMGEHQGRAGTMFLPALLVELVTTGPVRIVLPAKIVANDDREHLEARRRFAMGAPVTVDLTAEGEGMTEEQRHMLARHRHLLEAEAMQPQYEAELAALPANASPSIRAELEDHVRENKAAIALMHAKLLRHHGGDAAKKDAAIAVAKQEWADETQAAIEALPHQIVAAESNLARHEEDVANTGADDVGRPVALEKLAAHRAGVAGMLGRHLANHDGDEAKANAALEAARNT
jgi:hypothetical protein